VSKPAIFISHSAKSKKHQGYLETLEQALDQAGFSPWVDRKRLQGGDFWNDELSNALVACHSAVLLCSRQSLDRDYVKHEISYLSVRRRTEDNFVLYPILLDGLQPKVMQKGYFGAIRFSDIQFATWGSQKCLDDLFTQLEPVKIAAEVPLSPSARLEIHLAEEVFSKISPKLLKAAADELKWTENSSWELPQGCAQLFTRHLFDAPMLDQYKALKEIELSLGDEAAAIFEQVAPCWVDERASQAFSKVLQAPPGERGAMVNAFHAWFTARMYLRRARLHLKLRVDQKTKDLAGAHVLEDLAGAHVPEGRKDGASLQTKVKQAITFQLGLLETDKKGELQKALQMAELKKESIISALQLSQHDELLKLLPALQEEYQTVTFVIAAGASLPAIDDALKTQLRVIEPLLTVEDEACHHNESYAYEWYYNLRESF
jgi:hypothetical protein